MRRLPGVVLSLMLVVPVPATADVWGGGAIGVYADEVGGYCQIRDIPGTRTLYVIHKFTIGSINARFRVELSSGFTGTLVAFGSPFSAVSGDPLIDVTVTYDNTCLPGSFEILSLQFLMIGTSEECSWVRVAPHRGSADGQIETFNCGLERAPAEWGGTHVQSAPTLWCPDSGSPDFMSYCRPYTPPTPVGSSTWGAVKAFYR
jgi:hypothetical protein